jgi:hypothetical protein
MKLKHALPACALALVSTAAAQTGRTMSLSAPIAIGYSSDIVINHPIANAGDFYVLLWSTPFAGTVDPMTPGINGLIRVDLATAVTPWIGNYSNATSTAVTFPVPNDPLFLGFAFDLQSADLDKTLNEVNLADNDLEIVVGGGICRVNIARATTSSLTAGNNDIRAVDDQSIGAPVSQGIPTFAYLPFRHRGDEGFVEGYAGTFSSTSHNSDIDSLSYRRGGRRLANGAYQVIATPNGFDLAVVRDEANGRIFRFISHERATGITRVVPGTEWTDTGTSADPAQQRFYPGLSRDGQWMIYIIHDSNTASGIPDRVLAFRTDGQSPAVDITAVTAPSATYFDATIAVTNDFIFVVGSGGWYWTSLAAPAALQSLPIPNTTATNAPAIIVFSFSWRVSPDGSTYYFPIGSNAASSRAEMDMVRVTNVAGVPVATNYTQFAAPTGIAEFGYSALTPPTSNNSSNGIRASVSPDGSKIAFLAATATTTDFPGLYVADGTANPTLHTVGGALFYSEVAFINDTTVMFFAGASNTAQALYSLDVPTGTITQVSAATDIVTRGQFWSLNKNFWYFIRSNSTSTVNDIVGVNCATGAVFSVTGVEFGTPGPVGTIRTGSFNTTADPWFALEMQLRRAPVGDYAYFTARKETGVVAVFEDANVFRFDIENGGQAVQLTSNGGSGAAAAIINIESLAISPDGNHVAWAQRVGSVSTNSEDVFHLNLGTNVVQQLSVSTPTGQSITDGSIFFTCSPVLGVVWSIGTGSTTVPVTNARVEWASINGGTPVSLTGAPSGTQLFQVIGTN